MRRTRRHLASALIAPILALPAAAALAQTPVALELVLAVDASGSVDADEFALQVDGLVHALTSGVVLDAIASTAPRGIAIAVVQWAGPGHQVRAIDWRRVSDAASVTALAAAIKDAGRQMFGETAIAQALTFSAALVESNRFIGDRRVIDVSGDGMTNFGPDPDQARDRLVADGFTINGLTILNEAPDLEQYYRDHVIGGDGAFVLAVAGYADFADAMEAKLFREIMGTPVGGVQPVTVTAALSDAYSQSPLVPSSQTSMAKSCGRANVTIGWCQMPAR